MVVVRLNGLREIAGCSSELERFSHQPGIPAFCPAVDFGDHIADLELARVETNYILYRELGPSLAEDDGA